VGERKSVDECIGLQCVAVFCRVLQCVASLPVWVGMSLHEGERESEMVHSRACAVSLTVR